MKKSFFLLILIFMINTMNAMDNNQLQTKDFEYDPYDYLFDKKSDGNNTIYQLKTEHNNEFSDILPTIGKYILTNPECKKHEITLDPPIKEWILKRLVFLHKHNKKIIRRLEHVGQLKKFDFQFNIEQNLVHQNTLVVTNNFTSNEQCGPSKPKTKIEDFDSWEFTKQITRAAIYLTDKLKNPHIELLNKIYTKGIAQNKIYSLNELEEKHFKLLPPSFQAVLSNQVDNKKQELRVKEYNKKKNKFFENLKTGLLAEALAKAGTDSFRTKEDIRIGFSFTANQDGIQIVESHFVAKIKI